MSLVVNCVFFFKQKTAYEMRISDWSSDVCSSDLAGPCRSGRSATATLHRREPRIAGCVRRCRRRHAEPVRPAAKRRDWPATATAMVVTSLPHRRRARDWRRPATAHRRRSEEHTYELQSLMRISYAVFCLKKKKKKK